MKKNLFKGSLFTVGASLWWGVIGVLYFKFVSFASALELAIHRTLWTALLLFFTTTYFSKWKEFNKIVKKKTNLIILFFTGLLISINWLTWLYAVQTNNLLDGALGYYIFPILSVFLGIIFLKEKYNRNQVVSVTLVGVALTYLLIKLGEVPWIGITVAVTFSIYGLIRKKVKVSSDIGLLVETLLISPIAICLFIYLVKHNSNIFSAMVTSIFFVFAPFKKSCFIWSITSFFFFPMARRNMSDCPKLNPPTAVAICMTCS